MAVLSSPMSTCELFIIKYGDIYGDIAITISGKYKKVYTNPGASLKLSIRKRRVIY